jgi:hypothetical protein
MKKILLVSTLALSLISCGENRSDNKPILENAVDNAESSVSGSLKSKRYSGDGNIINEIYYELIKNDKNLQVLDDKIENSNEKSEKVILHYNTILGKSSFYYLSANYNANAIGDSLLQEKIVKEIKMSADKYNLKIKNIKDLISQVTKNKERMNDLYTVFKIKKTLPEIEKYQNAHPLKTDSLNNFINKQNQLLNELKNLK